MSRLHLPVLIGSLLAAAAGTAAAQDVTGAGATFPAPVYAKWADVYQKATGVRVNYQSVGSGAGIKQVKARTVTFGATDMPLKDEDLEKNGLLQFPTVIGGVVPVVNVKGIQPGQLKLTGPVLADIYLGKITRWNAPALTALNPGVTLPDQAIAVVQRSDGSGTSFLFTNYLSKSSADWKAAVGESTSVKWPVGFGGKGNEGVASYVQKLPGAIGYVEYAYVKQNKMTYALLKNQAGHFVAPDDANFKAAAASADWSRSFYQVLTNLPGKDAWPLTGATYILIPRSPEKPEAAAAALKFFDWAYASGDAIATELKYVVLPDSLKTLVHKQWSGVQGKDGKALAFK